MDWESEDLPHKVQEYIEGLETELARLRDTIEKARKLAVIDKWPDRYPRVYGRLQQGERLEVYG